MRRTIPWLSLAWLACGDGAKDRGDDPPAPGDDADTDTDADSDSDTDADSDTDSDTDPVAAEECDGIDNDGDGQTDEDFDDFDGDTIADCVDDDCDVLTTPVAVTLIPLPCTTTYEMQLSHSVSSQTPWGPGVKAGRLVDHDGDGIVGPLDTPTLVNPTATGLDYFDAATGVRDLFVAGVFDPYTSAVVDVDGDGDLEALAATEIDPVTHEWAITAYAGDGTVVWASTPRIRGEVDQGNWWWGGCDLLVADLEADGTNDVVCGDWVLNGQTGEDRFDLVGAPDRGVGLAADLDLDGTAEIVLGSQVFDYAGAVEWALEIDRGRIAYPAVVQLDSDPEAELVFATHGEVLAFEHDGAAIGAPWDANADWEGRPCVVDVDGDGLSEVGVPFLDAMVMFDTFGALMWSNPHPFGYGCSAFDFDVDGIPEILLQQGSAFQVLDAATGAVLLEDSNIMPVGGGFVPLILDVDGDDSAEIFAQTLNPMGMGSLLYVYEHPARAWPGSGSGWGVVDFAEGRVSDDGVVGLPSYWLEAGSQVRVPTTPRPDILDLGGVELVAELLDACAASCEEGPQKFSIQISNQGGLVAPAGIELELLTRTPAETVIGTAVLGEIPSDSFEIVTFRVEDPGDTRGRLFARIASPYATCSKDSLEMTFRDDQCP